MLIMVVIFLFSMRACMSVTSLSFICVHKCLGIKQNLQCYCIVEKKR